MRRYFALAAAAAALTAALAIASDNEPWSRLSIGGLAESRVGSFPRVWRTWPMQRSDASRVYTVAEEKGRRFIRAHDEWNLSRQIFLNFNWEVERRPWLSWSWRATTLPEGGDESRTETNDSACGIYVVVGRYQGHAIKYVWSTTLPPGRVVSRRGGKLKIKVLDSGPAKKGQWVSQSVNVKDDYKALFGRDLDRNPSGIGILTDGNDIGVTSGCDYADFAISGRGG